mmetsp:Transcript_58669/g.168499  ORF Transcript_58669/g.168499 Transcript_58669/m.168499 type:complete len:242 (-) Transcript_58669:132-857(-)
MRRLGSFGLELALGEASPSRHRGVPTAVLPPPSLADCIGVAGGQNCGGEENPCPGAGAEASKSACRRSPSAARGNIKPLGAEELTRGRRMKSSLPNSRRRATQVCNSSTRAKARLSAERLRSSSARSRPRAAEAWHCRPRAPRQPRGGPASASLPFRRPQVRLHEPRQPVPTLWGQAESASSPSKAVPSGSSGLWTASTRCPRGQLVASCDRSDRTSAWPCSNSVWKSWMSLTTFSLLHIG